MKDQFVKITLVLGILLVMVIPTQAFAATQYCSLNSSNTSNISTSNIYRQVSQETINEIKAAVTEYFCGTIDGAQLQDMLEQYDCQTTITIPTKPTAAIIVSPTAATPVRQTTKPVIETPSKQTTTATPAVATPAKQTTTATPAVTTPAKQTTTATPAVTTPAKQTTTATPVVTTPAKQTTTATPVVTTPAKQTTTATPVVTTPAKQTTTTPEKQTTTTIPTKQTTTATPSTTQMANNATATLGAYEQQVVDLVNKERTAAGLPALKVNTKLSGIAEKKAEDMRDNNYFSHTSPTYGSPFDMMKQFGISYTAAGENIAKGQKTPEAVMNGWMNSEGHRANILNSSFTEIGVGYVTDSNGTTYWVQEFIRP